MISILIPTYNYNILPLVSELNRQCIAEDIPYEIMALDDASEDQEITAENSKINALPHCVFERNASNLGRTKTRALLCEKATYDRLLFLDADVMPGNAAFIKNYLSVIGEDATVFGGYQYENKRPEQDKILRYVYGKTSEEKSAAERNKNPYQYVFSGNFLIAKADFIQHNFQGSEKYYGLDPYFAYQLLIHHKKVMHIDNAVYHLGLENNEIYFKKSLEAIDVKLELMLDLKDIHKINPITRYYLTLKKYGALPLMALLFKIFGPFLKKMVFQQQPNMWCFKLYKLGYMCAVKPVTHV